MKIWMTHTYRGRLTGEVALQAGTLVDVSSVVANRILELGFGSVVTEDETQAIIKASMNKDADEPEVPEMVSEETTPQSAPIITEDTPIEVLQAALDDLGVTYDRRWGQARLFRAWLSQSQ